MGLAIVALPSEDEKVYQISSEKIPHLTLCFLGDQVSNDDLITIVEFVQHAASQLSPFGLTVDHRGPLGPDDADVLFFEKNSWDIPRIASFRGYLLMNDTIQKAYQSVEQFPEWTPHLTLGYPATPAKEDPSEHKGIHHVGFNRIAVWVGDFSGPEFRLKYDDYPMDVAMSDFSDTKALGADVTAELFHYGVLGMKWGQHKADVATARAERARATADRRAGKLGNGGDQRRARKLEERAAVLQARKTRVENKKAAKADKKWEKSIYTVQGAVAVHNASAEHFNARIDALNAKHPDAHLDFPDKPETKAYMKDIDNLIEQGYASAIKSVHGTSPSGKKKAVYVSDENGSRIEVRSTAVKHADNNEPDLVFLVKLADGKITEVNKAEEEVAHAEAVESFLAHYGVKGMRWGVTTVDKASKPTLTREKKAFRNSKDVTVTQRKAGTYVKTRGGQRQKASDDAVKAAAARQKAKKSTTDALTNDELKAAVERMNLEQQYQKLESKTKRRGESFISRLFMSPEGRKMTEDLAKRVAATN